MGSAAMMIGTMMANVTPGVVPATMARGPMTSLYPTLAAVVREKTGATWSRARQLCADGRVTIDGVRRLDPAERIPPGTEVVVAVHGPKLDRGPLTKEAIVFADRDVVVVDKPAGMLTVADEPGNKDTLADHLRTVLGRIEKRVSPGLGVVHRIDRDTSGLVVFTRTADAKRKAQPRHPVPRPHHRSRVPRHRFGVCPRRENRDRTRHGSRRRAARVVGALSTRAGRGAERREARHHVREAPSPDCAARRSSNASWRQAASTRSVSISRRWDIHCWASASTFVTTPVRRSMRRAQCSTRAGWASFIPGAEAKSSSSGIRPRTSR